MFEKIILSALGLFLLAGVSVAVSPDYSFDIQGKLTDNSVPPRPVTGQHKLTFNLYFINPASPEALLISTTSETNVQLDQEGEFKVNIRFPDGPYLPSAFKYQLNIGMQVDNGGELLPRQPLGGTAYAVRARAATDAAYHTYVLRTGDTMKGTLYVKPSATGTFYGVYATSTNGGLIANGANVGIQGEGVFGAYGFSNLTNGAGISAEAKLQTGSSPGPYSARFDGPGGVRVNGVVSIESPTIKSYRDAVNIKSSYVALQAEGNSTGGSFEGTSQIYSEGIYGAAGNGGAFTNNNTTWSDGAYTDKFGAFGKGYYGVTGIGKSVNSSQAYGVAGIGGQWGIIGSANNDGSSGIFGESNNRDGYAGYFRGGKGFKTNILTLIPIDISSFPPSNQTPGTLVVVKQSNTLMELYIHVGNGRWGKISLNEIQ